MNNRGGEQPSDSQKKAQAMLKVLSAAKGKRADDIRSMLAEELRAQGIEPSSETIESGRALIARAISSPAIGRPVREAQTRRNRRRWTCLLSPARITRSNKVIRDFLPQYQPQRNVWFVDPDRTQDALEVLLNDDARRSLAAGEGSLPKHAERASRIDVWLDFEEVPGGPNAVRVHLKNQVLGRLRPESLEVFREMIEDAAADRSVLMTSGYIKDDANGLQFYIFQPLLGLS